MLQLRGLDVKTAKYILAIMKISKAFYAILQWGIGNESNKFFKMKKKCFRVIKNLEYEKSITFTFYQYFW